MSTASQIYQTSHIKRARCTRDEVGYRRSALMGIVEEQMPMTVRQVFYQASIRGLVDKDEAGYAKVQTDLVWLRRNRIIPYFWLTDNTRVQRRPRTFNSAEDALKETARLYRKSLWTNANAYVEIWIEKDALSGVILPITFDYDVPLMVARGYSSLSFLHGAAEDIAKLSVPAYIYHLGDYDPSGVDAANKIEQTLKELAPRADIQFERLGVTPAQIRELNLPSRPTKKTDTRAKNFGDDRSVELDSIPPNVLRDMVESAILRHVSNQELDVLRVAEDSERDLLKLFVESCGAA